MGADIFFYKATGSSAKDAFITAINQARAEHGDGGYTGTIAEKRRFTMIELPEGKDPLLYAGDLLENDDRRIGDKWGPAGCIKLPDNQYLFFGWAST
jgi:hypothetical protein